MKLLRPFTVTDANLTSSVVEAGTYPEYASTATYAEGDQVMDTARSGATHHVYESIVSGNVGNALTDSSKWLDLGPTNRFAMFDQKNGTATTDTTIDVSVDVTGRADGLALLGLDAQTVSVSMQVDGVQHSNLFTYSEDLSNAAWGKSDVTVAAATIDGPVGISSVWTVNEGSTTAFHSLNRSIAVTLGETYTVSIYAKAGTASVLQILFDHITGTNDYANFDLSSGTVTAGSVTSAIESIGDGWYRCSVTGASGTGSSSGIYISVCSTTTDARLASYAGTDRYLYATGAQLDYAGATTSYIETTSAAVTTTLHTPYRSTFDLQQTDAITSWYAWFSEEITYQTDLILTNLPLYTNPVVSVSITGGGSVSCGSMVVGQTRELGMALYGARAGINDYSRKDTDDFGNYTIVERAFAKRTVLKLVTDNTDIDSIHALLAAYRVTPAVWIGTDDYTCTWVFGFYKAFDVEIAMMEKSYVTLEIEGLT